MENKIKWGTIIPLVGGMTVGNKNAVGSDPDLIVSYSAFADNDQHCKNYFKDTPFVNIDSATNVAEYDISQYGRMDFVSTVCPCAGLSQLNSSTNTAKGRGSDAIQNEWMYKSASFVLEQMKPKVFWGENAPGLYGKVGTGVVERLRRIGEENGYAFSMVKTDTFLHGIPQHRHRTFYFFWEGDKAPIMSWYKKETPILPDYLAQIPENATEMDRFFGIEYIDENPWFKMIADHGYTIKDLYAHGYSSVFAWVEDGRFDLAIKWAEENSVKNLLNVFIRARRNKEEGRGLWVDPPILFTTHINSLIGRYRNIIHPIHPRGLTVREAMHLMGLPNDFNLAGDNMNHLCQNVPTTTAADWTREVIKFVNGEVKEWGGKFVKQNNESQKVDLSEKIKVYNIL
jgi:site-specific DNA-cytosine methylase